MCPAQTFPTPNQVDTNESETEEVVAFLCQRFSGLINRVQKAEASINDDKRKCAGFETALRDVEERRLAEGGSEKGELSVLQDEVQKLRTRLAEARQRAKEQTTEIQQAREENGKLEKRCAELSSSLECESQRAQEVTQVVNQEDTAYNTYKQQHARLHDRIYTMSVEYDALTADLSHMRERGVQQRARIKELEMKSAEEVRLRDIAERKAQTQHEELCSALRKLAFMKERLSAVQTQLVHKERDLSDLEKNLGALRTENQQRQAEVTVAAKKLNCLCTLEAQHERSIRENAEARSELETETARRKQAKDKAAILDGKHQEAIGKLQRTVKALLEAEGDVSQLQAQLTSANEENRQKVAKIEELEKERKNKASIHRNLRDESQVTFSEHEVARQERDEIVAETEDLRRRVKQMTPLLESGRRRWEELEEREQGLQKDVKTEKKARELLQRNVATLQKQLRTGRRQNLRLMEQVQDREEHLLRCFSYAVEHPGDLAIAARNQATRPLHILDASPKNGYQGASPHDFEHATPGSPRVVNVDPAEGASHAQQGNGSMKGNASMQTEGQPAPWTPSKSLGYLKTWMEIEEARLVSNATTVAAHTPVSGTPEMLERLLGDAAHHQSPSARKPPEPSPGGYGGSSMASPDNALSEGSYVLT